MCQHSHTGGLTFIIVIATPYFAAAAAVAVQHSSTVTFLQLHSRRLCVHCNSPAAGFAGVFFNFLAELLTNVADPTENHKEFLIPDLSCRLLASYLSPATLGLVDVRPYDT